MFWRLYISICLLTSMILHIVQPPDHKMFSCYQARHWWYSSIFSSMNAVMVERRKSLSARHYLPVAGEYLSWIWYYLQFGWTYNLHQEKSNLPFNFTLRERMYLKEKSFYLVWPTSPCCWSQTCDGAFSAQCCGAHLVQATLGPLIGVLTMTGQLYCV